MLWHWYGLQGSGKSWGCVVFAEDFHIKEGKKVYANFRIEFGEYIDFKAFMDFEYNDCVVIIDEAYGVADSHVKNKANDLISYVILQSRKRGVEVFFATQNEGDLYKRIREDANRKVLCQNLGTEKEPILRYFIMDNYGIPIESLEFDTPTVKSAYHLYDTNEKIMPMYLNKNMTFEKVEELFSEIQHKKTFCTLIRNDNPFITGEIAEAIFELMESEKYDKVRKLLKAVG